MNNYKKNSALALRRLLFSCSPLAAITKRRSTGPPAPPAETTPAPTANITVTPDSITPARAPL